MIRVSDLKDKTLGKVGTPKRDKYERELKLEIIAEQIKQLREEKNLTQEQLGELIECKELKFPNLKTVQQILLWAPLLKYLMH